MQRTRICEIARTRRASLPNRPPFYVGNVQQVLLRHLVALATEYREYPVFGRKWDQNHRRRVPIDIPIPENSPRKNVNAFSSAAINEVTLAVSGPQTASDAQRP